jgi:8-oxo-dGTP pyrophosphatase MutT (NUDIX family)
MSEPVIRIASTTILVRQEPSLEVLMVKRNQKIDFFSGAMVFPGGKIEPGDLDQDWANVVHGWSETAPDERVPKIAAIRECFEECGVLLATDKPPVVDIEEARAALDVRDISFLEFVRRNEVGIDLALLTYFARWLTPPIVPKRFDTFFFLTEMPRGQDVIHDGKEAIESEWIAPARALELSERGERTILFPTRMNLRLLAQSQTLQEAFVAARKRPIRQVSPKTELRGEKRYLLLSAEDGYGEVAELLKQ